MKKAIIIGVLILVVALLLFIRFNSAMKHDRNASFPSRETVSSEASSPVPIQTIGILETPVETADYRILPDGRKSYRLRNMQYGRMDIYDFAHGLPELAHPWDRTEEHEKAMRHGARGKVTLHVVDSTGKSVANANVIGGFELENSARALSANTDKDGLAEMEGKSNGESAFTVTKDGYYQTFFMYYFTKRGLDCVKDGRWLPWDPVLEVVLKEERNPEKMIVANKSLAFPKGQTVGFDFEVGDLVSPYGNGMSSDISFWFEQSIQKTPYWYSNNIVVSACDGGSIATLQKDSFSQFQFAYEAPRDGWMQGAELGLVRTYDKILSDVSLKENEYWVVKTHDKLGNQRFGIISGFSFGGSDKGTNFCGVGISFIFNKSPNSRNLEFSRKPDNAEL